MARRLIRPLIIICTAIIGLLLVLAAFAPAGPNLDASKTSYGSAALTHQVDREISVG